MGKVRLEVSNCKSGENLEGRLDLFIHKRGKLEGQGSEYLIVKGKKSTRNGKFER